MPSSRLRRYAVTIATATAVALPLMGLDASASASTAISSRQFGMHYLSPGNPLLLGFGSARIWDMKVSWKDLQPTSGATNATALSRLDAIVTGMRNHGAQPMITLGMTPTWAADNCSHVSYGVNWGRKTCAPRATGATSPWGNYVRMLAKRYKGKVRYFEVWNEPSLRNGYNDSVAKLARMQGVAQSIVHHYGAKLLSPGVPFTNGTPQYGLNWINNFLSKPGGKHFDVLGLHLYPADAVAKAGWGPEWSMVQLAAARTIMRRHGISRPVWDTETNAGGTLKHVTFTGARGAGQVAREYILATQNHVGRTFWYAADVRQVVGTWLMQSGFHSLAAPGLGFRALRNLLVGARPYGCSRTTVGAHKWHYTCRYHLANGRNMLAVWSTGRAFSYHGPRGTRRIESVTGSVRSASSRTRVTVGSAPVYVIGTFRI